MIFYGTDVIQNFYSGRGGAPFFGNGTEVEIPFEIKPPLSAAVSPSHETQTIRSLGHLFSISSPFPWQCFVQVESKYEKEF